MLYYLGQELTAEEEDFCGEFQPWLQQKYQIQTVASWAQIISSHAEDDAEAFQIFFQLLNEFLSRNKAVKDSLVA
jgi:recombinational DNA repair protein (RecF pathway)